MFVDNYDSNSGNHFYNEVRRGDDEEMPESPGYHNDSYQYQTSSMSGSNSCDEDDERDYDGKRSGDSLAGLAAKKRRKQSKPIRLGSEEEEQDGGDGGDEPEAEEDAEVVEEGEIARFRRMSGESGEAGQDSPPSHSDAPLNLSAVSKQSENEKSEPAPGENHILWIFYRDTVLLTNLICFIIRLTSSG